MSGFLFACVSSSLVCVLFLLRWDSLPCTRLEWERGEGCGAVRPCVDKPLGVGGVRRGDGLKGLVWKQAAENPSLWVLNVCGCGLNRYIADKTVMAGEKIERLVVCSGQVYYDLIAAKEKMKNNEGDDSGNRERLRRIATHPLEEDEAVPSGGVLKGAYTG